LGLAKHYVIRTMLSTNLSIGRLDAEGYVASGLDFLVLSIGGVTQPILSAISPEWQSGRRLPEHPEPGRGEEAAWQADSDSQLAVPGLRT